MLTYREKFETLSRNPPKSASLRKKRLGRTLSIQRGRVAVEARRHSKVFYMVAR